MVTIQVKNIEGKTILPVAGSEVAAGYDIVAIDDPIIVGDAVTKEGEFFPFYRRIEYIEYRTSLFISPQKSSNTFSEKENYHTLLHPRSSVRKYNLVLANSIGLIDNDYRGEIIICFKYIWQPEDFVMEHKQISANDLAEIPTGKLLGNVNGERIYKKGDKIAQLVAEITNPIQFVLVSELDATVRGEGGFGSTDNSIVKISSHENKTRLSGAMYPKEVFDAAIKKVEETQPQGTLADLYQKAGGIPIKKKYGDEVKERQN